MTSRLVTAEDFVVETKVFLENQQTSILTTRTVFCGPQAYDVVKTQPSEIARFDFQQKLISLVDSKRRIRANISFADILRFQSELRVRALRIPGLSTFLADPTFIRELDANKSTIKLSSPWLTYEAEGSHAPREMVDQLADFADWSARLASMLNPTAPPAEARIELNHAVKKLSWKIDQVKRTGGPRSRKLGVVRSEHQYHQQLTEQDRGLIQDFEKDLEKFEEVPFLSFITSHNPGRAITKK